MAEPKPTTIEDKIAHAFTDAFSYEDYGFDHGVLVFHNCVSKKEFIVNDSVRNYDNALGRIVYQPVSKGKIEPNTKIEQISVCIDIVLETLVGEELGKINNIESVI